MLWTLERDDALRARISTGQSYSAIAGELTALFDDQISRNAVIGRAARMGITAAHKPAPQPAPKPKSKRRHNFGVDFRESSPKPKADGRQHRAAAAPPVWMQPAPPRKPVPFDMPLVQRYNLLDLTARTCRFPIGAPEAADFFFCGGPPIEGYPYCGFHCRMAYRRPGQEGATA
jgi:GcrA cell cycle regulator